LEVLVNKRDDCVVDLSIVLPTESVKEELEKAYSDLSKRVKIPGFRTGKVPRAIVEARYGKKVEFDVVDSLISKSYQVAVKKENLEPVSPPKFGKIRYKKNEPLSFEARVEVRPEFEISDYKGLVLEREERPVTEEDVSRKLSELQEMHAELISVQDRNKVEMGDVLIVDYEGFCHGEPIPNTKRENFLIVLGETVLAPGADEKIVGMKRGQEKEIELTMPKDHPDKKYAGKKVTFRVLVKEIKQKVLPPLDDEFAKDVGGFDSMNELKRKIREDLERLEAERAHKALQDKALDAICEKVSFSLPPSMVERETNALINAFARSLSPKTIQDYLKENKMTLEALKQDFLPKAERSLKRGFVIDTIAKKEGIEVTEEEVDERISAIAEGQNIDVTEMKLRLEKDGKIEDLKADIRIDKSLNFLLEHAEIKEKTKEVDV
jgi:trigger factor